MTEAIQHQKAETLISPLSLSLMITRTWKSLKTLHFHVVVLLNVRVSEVSLTHFFPRMTSWTTSKRSNKMSWKTKRCIRQHKAY